MSADLYLFSLLSVAVDINKKGSFLFFSVFQPIAFAVICTLSVPSGSTLISDLFFFSSILTFISHLGSGPGDSTASPGKEQSSVSRCVLQSGTHTHTHLEKRSLFGKRPVMLLGCFPSRDWPIFTGPICVFYLVVNRRLVSGPSEQTVSLFSCDTSVIWPSELLQSSGFLIFPVVFLRFLIRWLKQFPAKRHSGAPELTTSAIKYWISDFI